MNALAKARRAVERYEQARQARDEAIREAAESHNLREVAEATGISKPRVHQIVRGG